MADSILHRHVLVNGGQVPRRDSWRRWLGICTALATVVVLGTSQAAPAHSPQPAVRTSRATDGGTLIYRASYGPDWIDPGLTWYNFGYTITYATNRPLYSSDPEHPSGPVPDLAAGPPLISDDGLSVTVPIRSGVHYSPPVNREVTSQDVKYAVERAFSENVPNAYVRLYFGDLVGAPDARGPIVDIPGIETPDPHTIVFHLQHPTAPALVGALMLPITVPVPEEYAAPFDAMSPSEYDTHVAFTGPYMIKADATGFLTGLGDDIVIVRNPNWDPSTDYRPAHLDRIRYVFDEDPATDVRRTLHGSHTVCCDVSPSYLIPDLMPTYPDQIVSAPGHGTRWVALNTTLGPLRNLNVRKAISAALNRDRLRAARGGPVVGSIAKHYIPPGLPGFHQSSGHRGFTDADFLASPSGDPALAKDYMLKARRQGVPVTKGGQYDGDATLLMVGSDTEPGLSVAKSVERQVERLGFRVHLRLTSNDRMYNDWCSVRSAKVAICPNVGWFFDFFDPQSLLQPTFDGDAIFDGGSSWSFLDQPWINEAMDRASLLPPGPDRWGAWAAVNHLITKQAPAIPYLWDTDYQVESSDVDGVISPYTSRWDLSFTSLR